MSRKRPAPKPWIEQIHAYVPGKSASDDGRPLIKLSANENPLGCSPAALEALQDVARPAAYPDPNAAALRTAIAGLHGIEPERIVCGTGSDELLNLAAQGFAGPGDEVLFSDYSFSVYDIAARRCGAVPVVAPATNYGADVDALLGCVTDRTRVVYLANPNNPTGTYLSRREVARLHAGLRKDILFVLDQAYAEYLDPGDDDAGLALAGAHDNVLVTRTFSKIYGLAGERIGWATGAQHLIDILNRIRGPFNVTASGQRAAIAALGDQAFVERSRQANREGRDRFAERMAALGNYGVSVLPGQANFLLVFFDGKTSAEKAMRAVNRAGYAVRHLPAQGLPNALRITIGQPEDMDRVADAIAAAVWG